MSVQSVDARVFAEWSATDAPVLLDFYAEWCGPCRMLAPVIEEIAAAHPTWRVGKVNVDEQPELAARFGVSSIPFVAYMVKGELRGTSLGYRRSEELLEELGL